MENKYLLTLGSQWYVKLPRTSEVRKVTVADFTNKTVQFINELQNFGMNVPGSRYLIQDIIWIECIDYILPTPETTLNLNIRLVV